MKEVLSYKGLDIFQEQNSDKFIVCMDTPDGMVRSGQTFHSVDTAKDFIDTISK